MLPTLTLSFYLILTLAALSLYGGDKVAAKLGRRRSREFTLLTLSIVGGAFGGLLAMLLFRHKTRKPVFWAVNLLSAAAHLVLIGLLTR